MPAFDQAMGIWWIPELVKGHPTEKWIMTIKSPHKEYESQYDDKSTGKKRIDAYIEAEMDGVTKRCRLYKEAQKAFIKAWGGNSDTWVGKQFKVRISAFEKEGKPQEVLRYEPIL